MKKIRYVDYTKYEYEWKFEFVKAQLSYYQLVTLSILFERYMQDDIRIKWDLKDEED